MITSERGMLDSLSAVLFDLDDTLLDSISARVRALQDVFKLAGILRPKAKDFLRDLQGTQLKTALLQLQTNHKIESNLFESYRSAYWLKKPGMISLYPGVKLMLEELHSRGVKLGVVTQKGREFEVEGHRVGALREMKELNIADVFSVIVGFEDVRYSKPHPEGIRLALGTLETHPQETLMVGDSYADIEMALAAGCWSCLAT